MHYGAATAVLASFAALAMTSAQATTGVGATPGAGGVSATGAATYTIPIVVPPGTHGMQPILALSYDSQSGDSEEGYGWSLTGFAAISRCNKNADDDGQFQAVQIASSDDFCLDGQRLRLASGSYGAPGSTYRTEINDYSVITAFGSGNVINYFTVQTKDGRIYEYGNTSDSKMVFQGAPSSVRTWALDKVTDASGNFMTYSYTSFIPNIPGLEYVPQYISYTGNGSTQPDHTIEFDYANRANSNIKFWYDHGSVITLSGLLTTIKVLYGTGNPATTTYNLTYNQDPANGRSRLASVQQCGLNSDCLPATTIAWANSQGGWVGDASTGVTVSDAAHAAAAHLMDVDGDGIDDLVYPDSTSNDWEVMFGKSGGGFNSPVDTGVGIWHTANFYQFALAVDYNGDGKMDLMMPIPNGWLVMEGTGNRAPGAGNIFVTPSNNAPDMSGTNSVTGLPIYEGNVWMADFGGGELADMFDVDGSHISWQQNDGPPNEVFAAARNVYSSTDLTKVSNPDYVDVGIDFDGSGRAGALLLSPATSTSLGTLTALTATSSNTLTSMGTISNVYFGAPWLIPFDSNGDGLTDVLSTDQNEYWRISLSTGIGFNTLTSTVTAWTNPSAPADALVADYANIGHQNAIVYIGGSWDLLGSVINRSSGTITLAVTTSLPMGGLYPAGYLSGSVRVGHIEANGLDDLVYAVQSSGGYTFHYALHAGYNSTPGDLVTQITDGFGNYCQFTYASLSSGAPTYTQSGSPAYPARFAQSPMQVVSVYTASDGTGGSYTVTYTYANAEMDTQGHGFLGFGARNIKDSRYFNNETISYYQAFPFTGMVQQDVINANNGIQLEETDNNTWNYATQTSDYIVTGNTNNHTDAYFPFFDASEHHHYESVSGTTQEVSDSKTTIAAGDFDSFGNLTHRHTVVTDDMQAGAKYITDQTSSYPLSAPANNCFALPDSVTTTSTVPVGSLNQGFTNPATRTVTNNVNRATCQLSSQTVTSSADAVTLTTAYPSYDSFGNATEVDVSGTGIPATRVTTYSYAGGNNEFPTSVTHVVSGTDSMTSGTAWNYAFGIKVSDTDPNGNVTSYTPDDFGRLVTVIPPNGSQATLSYNWCPGTFCVQGAKYETTDSITSGNTSTTTGYTAYDGFGRPLEKGSVLLGGGMSKVDTVYNTLGDVAEVSKPFTGSQAQYYVGYTYATARNRVKEIDAPQDASDVCTPAYTGGSNNNTCHNVTTFAYGGVANSGFTVTTTHTVGDSASSSSTQVTSKTTDALGELLSTVDANGGIATDNYDASGDLVATQDADGKLTTMTYDGMDHKTGMVDPNMGSWIYAVDALGEVLCQTDAKGQSIIMGYDNVGRLVSKLETAAGAGCNATSGTSSVWTYDTQTKGMGLPASVTDSNGFERDYDYDSLSRPADVTITPGSGAAQYTVSTTYDGLGRVQTITYPASVAPTSAPTAHVTATPVSTTFNTNITLDGTASTDPAGLPLQYSWTQINGPANATITSPTSATTVVSASTIGVYVFQLVVSDANSGSTPATVTVSFGPAPPTNLALTPNPSYGYYALSWSGSTNSYRIYESYNGGPYSLLANTPYQSYNIAKNQTGTFSYTVAACVAGCGSPSSPVTETISSASIPGTPPSFGFKPAFGSRPASSASAAGGGKITIEWGAASGSVGYYKVTVTPAGSIGGGNFGVSTLSEIVSEEIAGTYQFTLQACNANGCSASTSQITLTVTSNEGNCDPSGVCSPGCGATCQSVVPQPVLSGRKHSSLGPIEQQMVAQSDLKVGSHTSSGGTQGNLTQLAQLRAGLVAKLPLQRSEAQFEAAYQSRSPARLLAPSKSDVIGWNAREDQLPGMPNFAPPVYIAYGDVQVKKASSTPYRFSVQYNYDPNSDLLQSVTNTATGFTYWQAATQNGGAPMDAWGHILGYVDGNNVSTVSAYDQATGAIKGISTGIGASTSVQQLAYSWDGFGNLKQRCDANRGLTENFAYDGLNRLAGSTVSTGATSCAGGTPESTLGMNYDAVGNISSRTNTGITVGSGTLNDLYSYGDPAHPYAVTAVPSMPGTYVYDANGNMTSGNGRTITWNDDNLPITISSSGTVNGNNTVTGSSTFSYSPDLQRYQQVTTDSIAGNSTTTYIGGLFEVVTGSGTTQYRHNIMAAGGVVAVHTVDQSGNATTAYIHADHLGSSDTITNDTGTVVQQSSFDAFGLRRNPNDWSYGLTAAQIAAPDPSNPTLSSLKGITDRGYTNQEQLDSVGLVHMNGRVYDPQIGKFISADPVEGGNRYAYAYNNPLRYTDPSGYCPLCLSTFTNPVTIATGIPMPANTAQNVISQAGQALAHPSIMFEDTSPIVGHYVNNMMARSQTMQEVGAVAAMVVSDVFGPEVYAGYAAYLADLEGASFGQTLQAGATGYAEMYLAGSLTTSGWGRVVGGGINGYLETGTAQGFVRGAVAGAIPDGFGLSAYQNSMWANIGLRLAVDATRGYIIGGTSNIKSSILTSESSFLLGNAIGFVGSGFSAPTFRNGAYLYDANLPLGYLTLGDVTIGANATSISTTSWIYEHEGWHRDSSFEQSLGGAYIPAHLLDLGAGYLIQGFGGGDSGFMIEEHLQSYPYSSMPPCPQCAQ